MSIVFCDSSATGSNNGTSWEDAYTTVQAAETGASDGDSIWIKARTFTLSSAVSFNTSGTVDIYGGFDTSLTGTSGSIAGRTAGVKTVISGGSSTNIGTVTRSGIFDAITFSSGDGSTGGLYINYSGSDLDFNDCYFYNNVGSYIGGAIRIGAATAVDFSSCIFEANSGAQYGGAVGFSKGAITFDNCSFIDNECAYQGSHLRGSSTSSVVCTDCTFSGGTNTATQFGGGGAVHASYMSGTVDFLRCILFNNSTASTGYGGAVHFEESAGSMTNCVMYQNTASVGGAVVVSSTTVQFTNCTMADNDCSTASSGGAIRVRVSATANLTNCILWGNQANSVDNQILNDGTANVTYSDVQGGYTGTGNVNDDPNFIGSGDDPYDLDSASSAVDSADSSATDYPATDILGRDRIDDGGTSNTGTGTISYADMGAYEFQSTTPAGQIGSLLLMID